MAEKSRLQVKGTKDPEKWEDVGAGDVGYPVPVVIEDLPDPLPVSETEDVDDDSIAKGQTLPLKLNLPYIFDKSNDRWVRQQGATDGYPFVRPIGVFDTDGHQLDIEVTTGAIYSNLKGFRSSDSTYQPISLD